MIDINNLKTLRHYDVSHDGLIEVIKQNISLLPIESFRAAYTGDGSIYIVAVIGDYKLMIEYFTDEEEAKEDEIELIVNFYLLDVSIVSYGGTWDYVYRKVCETLNL